MQMSFLHDMWVLIIHSSSKGPTCHVSFHVGEDDEIIESKLTLEDSKLTQKNMLDKTQSENNLQKIKSYSTNIKITFFNHS